MVTKRNYKPLNTTQRRRVTTLTQQGKSQKVIAKTLGVSKQRVATAQKKAKIGKRLVSPFWKDVAAHRAGGYSHKEAIDLTKYSPKWKKVYKKRTGKARVSPKDKDEIRRALREEWMNTPEGEKAQVEFEDEVYYITPK